MRVDKDNGKYMVMVKGRAWKFWLFSSNEFWKNIGCLILDLTFGLGGSSLWEKQEAHKIGGHKSKRRSIRVNVDFYEVFLSYFIHGLIYFILL